MPRRTVDGLMLPKHQALVCHHSGKRGSSMTWTDIRLLAKVPPGRTQTLSRLIVRFLFLLVLAVFARMASAASIDLTAGGSVTSARRSTTVAALDLLGATHRWRGITVQSDVGLSYVAARQHQGPTFDRGAWVAAAGIRLPELWKHMFFSFQLGAATPRTPALSSTQQFVSSVGWAHHGFVIMLRHISNGSTRKPNLGETMVLAGLVLNLR